MVLAFQGIVVSAISNSVVAICPQTLFGRCPVSPKPTCCFRLPLLLQKCRQRRLQSARNVWVRAPLNPKDVVVEYFLVDVLVRKMLNMRAVVGRNRSGGQNCYMEAT